LKSFQHNGSLKDGLTDYGNECIPLTGAKSKFIEDASFYLEEYH
jgi:hypothetical protein